MRSIGPLYSTLYPATTSDSVSAWSNGVRFDSKSNNKTKIDTAGLYKKINQWIFCTKTKSWKFVDCVVYTSKEYITVTKISKEITWTNARIVPISAYRDWLNNPTSTKKILLKRTNIKWYKINESVVSKTKSEGPHIKFCEKSSWVPYKSAKKIGARADEGRGIKKISFVSSFTKSSPIWNAPLRPIIAGPIRRCA